MTFTADYQILWHDTDANREVRPTQLLMYMQETANAQFRACGTTLDELRDREGLAFIVSKLILRSTLPLRAYDRIRVETWVSEGRGYSFPRAFRILRDGEIAAEADSVWALTDLSTRKLIRADAFRYPFPPESPLGGEGMGRIHFSDPEQMEFAGERRIVTSDIDYNGHMNNTKYPDLFRDFLPDGRGVRVREIAMSFLREASFGHTLKIYRAETPDGFFFRTVNEDGEVCAEARAATEPAEFSERETTES